MNRRAIAVGLVLLFAGAHLVPARAEATPQGSITWTVDHQKKTITALVRLQIYSGCSGNPFGNPAAQARACAGRGSQVTQLLADKIKGNAENIWNDGYRFRCYRLVVIVDVTLAPDRDGVAPDRIGVRIDPSVVAVRSWVHPEPGRGDWDSDEPGDRVNPSNEHDGEETTWSEAEQGRANDTYAHELGHILGLADTYRDVKDAATGVTHSVAIDGAPKDLMNGAGIGIDQETIDRLMMRNRDRLTDKAGNPVDIGDLRCELTFAVDFQAKQDEYAASNLMNSAVDPPCSRAPITGSSTQRIRVNGDRVEVQAIVDPSLPMGYVLTPTFDVLTVQNGMSGGGRAGGATGLFDVPIAASVFRNRVSPAEGDIPPPFDFQSKPCIGGDTGGQPPERPDCGNRTFRAWLAMKQDGESLWPVPSSLPVTLKDLGYSQVRLDKLYRRCSGPTPWPGSIAEQEYATKEAGKMPALVDLQRVYDDWVANGKPGSLEITGKAKVDHVEPGDYQLSEFVWVLVLCPVNLEGAVAPDCP